MISSYCFATVRSVLGSGRQGGVRAVNPAPTFLLCWCAVAADELQRLLRTSSGKHYFSSSTAALEPIGVALLHADLSGSIGPSFTRMLAKSK